MQVLLILGIILLALLLLGQVRIGAQTEYSVHGLRVWAKAGPLHIAVYPRKPRKVKEKRQNQKSPARPEKEPPAKPGGSLGQIKQFLPLVAEAAGRLRRKIRIDTFHMDVTAAAADPALAALAFGGTNAMIGMIWPLVEQNFKVKDRRIHTAVDFDARRPAVYLYAAATLTLSQALALAIVLTARLFRILSRQKGEKQQADEQKEAV